MIDRNIQSKTESNLCVSIHCLVINGYEIKDFSPCHISVGAVRNWITRNKYRKNRVFVMSGMALKSMMTPSTSSRNKSVCDSYTQKSSLESTKSTQSSLCSDIQNISSVKKKLFGNDL